MSGFTCSTCGVSPDSHGELWHSTTCVRSGDTEYIAAADTHKAKQEQTSSIEMTRCSDSLWLAIVADERGCPVVRVVTKENGKHKHVGDIAAEAVLALARKGATPR